LKGTETPTENSAINNSELETMKQEILTEMRKELNKMKQEILEGKHKVSCSRNLTGSRTGLKLIPDNIQYLYCKD